jgi:hypothetical protein
MWSPQNPPERWLRRRKTHCATGQRKRGLRPRLEGLEDRTVLSTLTVLNNLDSGAGSLRDTIAAASSGDTIVFARALRNQTIILTSGELAITKSLDIEGPGANRLTISGNDSSRVFDISGGVTVPIAGLTIAHGFDNSGDGGGGILNIGSTLTLSSDALSDDQARGPDGANTFVQGGAVNNLAGGILTVTGSRFLDNQVLGGDNGGGAGGGAIGNVSSTATISGSTFVGNEALGGNGGVNIFDGFFFGSAFGGAVYNTLGLLTVQQSTFTGNQAVGGSGGSGGEDIYFTEVGSGGAILNDFGGTLDVDGSTFTQNRAEGGSHATGGTGVGFIGEGNGGAVAGIGTLILTNSILDFNEAVGGSNDTNNGDLISDAGPAFGGAIALDGGAIFGFSGSLTASNLIITRNRAVGGADNTAGSPTVLAGAGTGGGLVLLDGGSSTTADIRHSTIARNQAIGGQGGDGRNGADGRGGGLATVNGGIVTVNTSLLTLNEAVGGQGDSGGDGLGGGIYTESSALGVASLTVSSSAIVLNQADGGLGGTVGSDGQGVGGGVYISPLGTFTFDAFTIIAYNHASTSNDNIYGVYTIC